MHGSGEKRLFTTPRNFPSTPECSANIPAPPRQQIPALCCFLRGHLMMIFVAKPRYATRQPLHKPEATLFPHDSIIQARRSRRFHRWCQGEREREGERE